MLFDDAAWFLPAYMNTLALRLQEMGRNTEVLETLETVEILYLQSCSKLGSLKRHAVFQPAEGGSLRQLSVLSRHEQQVEEALKAIQGAVRMRRSVLVDWPKSSRLCASWFFTKFSQLLCARQQFDAALDLAKEAGQIYWTLFNEYPDIDQVIRVSSVNSGHSHQRYSPPFYLEKLPAYKRFMEFDWFCSEMATCLRVVSVCRLQLKAFEEAMNAIEVAVLLQQYAVIDEPHTTNRKCLAELRIFALLCQQMGDLEMRRQASAELVSISLDFSADQSVVIRTARTLHRLLGRMGDFQRKLIIAQEVVSIFRDLAQDTFQVELARWLNGVSWTLQELGRFDEALEIGQESLQMTRAIATDTSESRFDLALVLDTVAVCLQKLGHCQQAREFGRESIAIIRQVLETNYEEAYMREKQLEHLGHHVDTLESLGQTDEVCRLKEEMAMIQQSLKLME